MTVRAPIPLRDGKTDSVVNKGVGGVNKITAEYREIGTGVEKRSFTLGQFRYHIIRAAALSPTRRCAACSPIHATQRFSFTILRREI